MSETKLLTPNNVGTEAKPTTNGEVQTGMLILVTPKATMNGTTKSILFQLPQAVHLHGVCVCETENFSNN